MKFRVYFISPVVSFDIYEGGEVANSGTMEVVGLETSVDFWGNNNNCQTAVPAVSLPDIDQTDNLTRFMNIRIVTATMPRLIIIN